MRKLMTSDYVWGGAAIGLIAYEEWAVHNKRWDDTCSHFLRRIFRTDTRVGQIFFLSGWYGFAVWLGYHIALEHQGKEHHHGDV